MKRNYEIEREGQIDFFNAFNIDYKNNEVLIDNTDGIWNGNLLEFKLNIDDFNKVLFQAIKYLSKMRIKGESIPANILLVSLNTTTVYLYHSQDYFDDIHKIYIGPAAKNNEGFISDDYLEKLDYYDSSDTLRLQQLLKSNNYLKIKIDENCIVGWAERYYRENPTASKGDFIGDDSGKVKIVGEIRQPNRFKQFILPYTEKTNEKFKYLMDRLNDRLKKKELGAFYTPIPYCQQAATLLRKAISKVPKGNDYVIIDRCAGTGNLESVLTDEELSHCILSTYEYYEYKVLCERLIDKVRFIVPPAEHLVEYSNGFVSNADALSKDFIENKDIQKYIQNPSCTIILYENPPYAETTSVEHQKSGLGKANSSWKSSYVVTEMKKEVSGTVSNDMGNAFIWSAFKYYLRQPTDSYIVFSPVKYWKVHHLVNKKFIDGFAFNRKHFHTKIDACIMCALWTNVEETNEEIIIRGFDIQDNKLIDSGLLPVKKIHSLISTKYYDKRKFSDDEKGIAASLQGTEILPTQNCRVKPIYNENIIGYMVVMQSGFDNPDLNSGLTTIGRYDGNGFFLRRDNYLEKLPLFAASRYITYNRAWTERTRIMKSGDGYNYFVKNFSKDNEFRKACLIFSCLETQNHCRSFKGSDGRIYQNMLCFEKGTIAYNDLQKMELSSEEQELITLYNRILKKAQKTKKYNKQWNYGIYQISQELNTFHLDENDKKIYDYPELNGDLVTLKEKLKCYYIKKIVPKLFEYELIK